MADQEQEQVKSVELKGIRVVKAVFGVDPKGNKRYEEAYPGARVNKSRGYSYITNQDVKEGDVAVVETPQGYTLVTIIEVGPQQLFGELPGHKWLIDTVDIEGHLNRQERAKRVHFLMESLSQRAKEQKKLKTFEDDLANDPASQELLKELKTLL